MTPNGTTGSDNRPWKGLSRVKGNLHARFLGGGGAATLPPLPDVNRPRTGCAARTAGLGEGLLQGMQLGRRHAHVDRALGHGQDVDAGVVQEPLEVPAQVVVHDAAVPPTLMGIRRHPE